jgi:DNA invertase Pin-like site-specific DNA recombinase
MAPPMKVALYTRVSTMAQADKHGTEYQRAQLLALAEQRGWEVVDVFSEEAVKGKTRTRPELTRMERGFRKGRYDAVVVWRFDRFARSLSHLVGFLDECRTRNVEFVSYSENIDTSTPLGRAMFQIAGAFAELESNLARERVMAGLANAKAKGVHIGRPRSPLTAQEAVVALEAHGSIRRAAAALGVSAGLVSKRLKEAREGQEDAA